MSRIVSPFLRRFRARLAGHKSLQDVAAEILVVAPGELNKRPEAISLPGQISRVRAVQPETTPNFEHARLRSGEVRHAPTRAFLLRNAWYLNGIIYAGQARMPQMPGCERLIDFNRARHVTEATLPSSWVGSRYFGHHVVDDSATTILATQLGSAFRAPAPAVADWPHAATYRARMGVDVPVLHKAQIAEAWVFEDWGMTAHRRTRLRTLRERLRDAAGPRSGHGVFLRRRGAGAARVLVNEEVIEQMLARLGFEIVDPANDSTETIISRCRDASVVVGVEGSGFSHGLLGCAPHAAFMVIQHPFRFNNIWKDFTDALGMRYAFLVGEGTRDAFRINPDELRATLDLL